MLLRLVYIIAFEIFLVEYIDAIISQAILGKDQQNGSNCHIHNDITM